MRHQHASSHAPGFTLLETVIAISIIAFGIVSIISLSSSALVAGRATDHQFVAAELAREAIEVVRAQRDSNWLAYDADSATAWNAGLAHPTETADYSAVVTLSGAATRLNFTPDTPTSVCGSGALTYTCSTMWLDAANQLYFQTAENPPAFNYQNFTDAGFNRMVYLYPICRDATGDERIIAEGAACTAAETQVGLDVTAVVQWSEGEAPQQFTLEEQLYDWK